MIATIYRLHGVSTDDDILNLRLTVSSYDEQVGGVSFERLADGSTLMIIKHREGTLLSTENISRLVQEAGPFTMETM
ncbi:hypothetical protein [Flaviflexus equikiangi]|uniref:Uncharacterized protein n=1 Tax=Flaviflexus equikiangi TaxID=2758573 RepID=A0ABS2TC37_9ACTO|nr:hypothetical protein [Flaviflexus equikiangi]MBM9432189.1 hypothetical protein [Flaviflexus equikiangi]